MWGQSCLYNCAQQQISGVIQLRSRIKFKYVSEKLLLLQNTILASERAVSHCVYILYSFPLRVTKSVFILKHIWSDNTTNECRRPWKQRKDNYEMMKWKAVLLLVLAIARQTEVWRHMFRLDDIRRFPMRSTPCNFMLD